MAAVDKDMVFTRKVVQIAATPEDAVNWASLYALCDDGMIYLLSYGPDGATEWVAEAPVPQASASVEAVLRQLILPWSEFSDDALDRRGMFDHHFRQAIKDARRLLG